MTFFFVLIFIAIIAVLAAFILEVPKAVATMGYALASILYVVAESYTVIPAGHIGIQVTFGTVNQETLSEGLHFVNPLSGIKEVDVRLVTAQLKGSSAGTKDLQQVHTDIVLNYRLDGSKAGHIYKEFGLNLEDRIVLPALNESFKSVTAHYSSEELITKRDEVSMKIKEEIGAKLAKYNVTVGDISLVNFGFSAEYQKAIEAKVIATQSKLQAEQDLARIEVEAKQAVAKAEGRAKAIQIETAAINSQGGASYVQLKAIEKWDGKLPTTQAGGATPFINVK
jgi:prohibitin 2